MATHELSNFVYSGPLTGNSYLFGVASGLADTNPDTIKLTLLYDYIKSLTDTLYPTQGQLSSLSDVVDAKMGRIGSVWQGQNFTTTAFAYATDPTGLVTKAQAEAIAAAAGGSYAGLSPHPDLDITADILQIYDVTSMAYYSVTPEALLLGAGYVNKTGTPVDNQIAVFTDADTIEGDAGLTWNASTLQILSGIGSTHFSVFAGSGNLAFEIGSYDTGTGGSNYATYFGVQAANVDGYSDGMYSQLQRGTFASPAAVADQDYVGMITAWAHDGTGARRVGGMATIIDGTPALNNIPTRLLFEVNTGASTTTIGVALNSDLSFSPYVDNAAALGNATYKWSDLYLASGGQIKWGSNVISATDPGAIAIYSPSGVNCSSLYPHTHDGGVLGSGTSSWSDLYLAAGGVVNWNNGAAKISEAAGSITIDGDGIYFRSAAGVNRFIAGNTYFAPTSNDGGPLGTATEGWSDLYLATLGVINWGGGEVTLYAGGDTVVWGGHTTMDYRTPSGVLYEYLGRNDAHGSAAYLASTRWYGKDSGSATTLYAGIDVYVTDATDLSEDGLFQFGVATAGTYAYALNLSGTQLYPQSDDTVSLGAASNGFSDLYLAAGAIIRANSGAGELYFDATNFVVQYGGTNKWASNATEIYPITNDGMALGTSSLAFSDLYLASGAVINWNAGDVTLTHASNQLTFNGANTYIFNTSTPVSYYTATTAFNAGHEFHQTSALATSAIARWSVGAAPSRLILAKSEGASVGTHGAVQASSIIGELLFNASDGTNFVDAGGIEMVATAGFSAGAGTARMDFKLAQAAYATDAFHMSSTAFYPAADDGKALGGSGFGWSDLYLASGATVNFAASDVVLTHATNLLTMAGGDLTISQAYNLNLIGNRGTTPNCIRLQNDTPSGEFRINYDYDGSHHVGFADGTNAFIYYFTYGGSNTHEYTFVGTGDFNIASTNVMLPSGNVLNWGAGDTTLTHATGYLTLDNPLEITIDATLGLPARSALTGLRVANVATTASEANITITAGSIGNAEVWFGDESNNNDGRVRYELGNAIMEFWTNASARVSLSTSSMYPTTTDTITLGNGASGWSDLYLATGGRVDWSNGAITVTNQTGTGYDNLQIENADTRTGLILQTTNNTGYASTFISRVSAAANFEIQAGTQAAVAAGTGQTYFGAASNQAYINGYTSIGFHVGNAAGLAFGTNQRATMNTTAFSPYANDGLALGTSSLGWSDLFLATGAVLNFGSSDITITHAAGALGMTGGYLNVFDNASASLGVLYATNTTDGAVLKAAQFGAQRSGAAVNNDTGYIDFAVKNSVGTNITAVRQYWRMSDVTSTAEDGYMYWAFMVNGTLTDKMAADQSSLNPTVNDGMALGTAAASWSDLFLANAGVINFNNGGYTLTHSGTDLIPSGTIDGRDIAADGATLDSLSATAVTLQGTWDASSGSFPGGGTAQSGYSYIVSVSGTVDSVSFVANDRIVAITDNASTTTYAANWHKLDYTDQVLSVASKTGAVTLVEADLSDLGTTIVLDSDIGSTVQAYSADNLFKTGTPANNQLAVFTNATTVEGTAELTFDSTTLSVNNGGVTVAPHTNAVDLVLANSTGNAGITIHGTSYGSIHFADGTTGTEPYAGLIRYYHPGNYFEWYVNGTAELRLDNTQFYPSSDDGLALGIGTNGWSDLYLANGGTINFNNNDVIIAHATNSLSMSGGQFSFYNDNSIGVPPIVGINQADGTSVYVMALRGDNTTAAANDEIYATWLMDDSAGTATEFARLTTVATNITDTTETGRFEIATAYNGTSTDVATFSRDTIQFLQEAGTRTFTINGQGCHFNTTFTVGSAEVWSSQGSLEVVSPITTRDNLWLKAAASQTADYIKLVNSSEVEVASWDVTGSLQLPTAATINWNAGDLILTHSSNNLTVSGGDMVFSDASYGVNFGAKVGASVSDVSKHIDLYSGSYGLNVTASTLGLVTNTYVGVYFASAGALHPTTDDAGGLGRSGFAWSDLYLASGGVIDFGNGGSSIYSANTDLDIYTNCRNLNVIDIGGTSTNIYLRAGDTNTSDATLFFGDASVATDASIAWSNANSWLTFGIAGTAELRLTNTSLYSYTNDGLALGTSSLGWSDLHLANGAVINCAAGVGTLYIDASGTVFQYGGSSQFALSSGLLYPTTNDGVALGNTTNGWADLHLATGGVINWANGDFTATHSSGALALSGNVDVGGAFSLSGDISPAQITADQNDYNPTGLSTATRLRLSTDATRTVTGLSGGADGRVVMIHNIGANALVLADEDVLSTAGNRFSLPNGDQALAQDETLLVCYDATTSRWRPVGGSGGGGASVTYAATPPGVPATGDLWYDTDTATLFLYTGSEWIEASPNPAVGASTTRLLDDISSGFNGSTTAFSLTYGTLAVTPDSENQLLITINAVVQSPSDYSVAGSTLTFSSAPAGTDTCDILMLPAGGGDATVVGGVAQFSDGEWVKLTTGDFTSAAGNHDIDVTPYTAYEQIRFVFNEVTVTTDGSRLDISFSIDGGSTFKTGSSQYFLARMNGATYSGAPSTFSGSAAVTGSYMDIIQDIGNAAGEAGYGEFTLTEWNSTDKRVLAYHNTWSHHSSTGHTWSNGVTELIYTDDITDVRFSVLAGNIDGGTWVLYGRNPA